MKEFSRYLQPPFTYASLILAPPLVRLLAHFLATRTGVIEGITAILENEDTNAIINNASSSGNKEIINLLLKKGASLHVRNKHKHYLDSVSPPL